MANSTLRLIQFNIIVLLALILTELEEAFPKEYISDFLVCTKSCTQPYIMKMAIYPDHLAQGGGALVWVPETKLVEHETFAQRPTNQYLTCAIVAAYMSA